MFRPRSATLLLVLVAACDQGGTPTAPPTGVVPYDAAANAALLVTSTADDGPGSLREALAGGTGVNTIAFDPALAGRTIVLATPLDIAGQTAVIEGPADAGVTISGNGVTSLFVVQASGGLTLRNLTLTNSGGGVGAVATAGTVVIEHSTLTGNRSVASSSGNGFGGAISHFGGMLSVVNSTISGNVAEQHGGGIASLATGGGISLAHTTMVGNTAEGRAGGVYLIAGAPPFSLFNTIIAGNSAGEQPNCDIGSLVRGYTGTNLVGEAGCTTRAEDIVAADPVVGPLADNGGPTRTHALLPGSPAVETAVPVCLGSAVDQRYVARPQGSHCDIGAFEFEGFVTPPIAIDAGGTINPNTGVAVLSGTINCPAPATLDLEVTLRQTQKLARVKTVVEATVLVPITCGGPQPWSAALAAATGGFRNGTGSVTARSVGGPAYLLSAEATRSVKLGWGRK